jgi:hypothetical protein
LSVKRVVKGFESHRLFRNSARDVRSLVSSSKAQDRDIEETTYLQVGTPFATEILARAPAGQEKATRLKVFQ